MTIQQLRYAVTISELGSLNKASEILYIAQPSLTSSVQELDRYLKQYQETHRGDYNDKRKPTD